MEINSKIRGLRKKQGLSLQELSQRCGLSKGYLSKIERSKDAPRIAVLQSIANALKVPITDFFDSGSKAKQVSKNLDMLKKEDWLDHEVLLFRDQQLTDSNLIGFSRFMGDLEQAPIQESGRRFVEGYPEIYVVSNVIEEGVPIGSLGSGEAVWHRKALTLKLSFLRRW